MDSPQVSLEKYLDSKISEVEKALTEHQAVYHAAERERAAWREIINGRLTVIETRSVTWTAAMGVFFLALQILVGAVIFYIVHNGVK